MDMFVKFLIGQGPYSGELEALGMAIQGAMIVRNGPNATKRLHWFHAFILSVVFSFAGGLLGFIWMGKPSSMLSNDLSFGSCIIAFAIVNYSPGDIGYKLMGTLPFAILTTMYAQLFRATGMMRFITTCFNEFQHAPSAYYPIPVFGPIIYGTLLGNMGGFVMKGLEGHVINGMPWPMQNGIFCATFFHFFVNDQKGPVGQLLRTYVFPEAMRFGLDERAFAGVFVSLFMQVMGILQMPQFMGPSFSPFWGPVLSPYFDPTTWTMGWSDSTYSAIQDAKQEAKDEAATKKTKAAKED